MFNKKKIGYLVARIGLLAGRIDIMEKRHQQEDCQHEEKKFFLGIEEDARNSWGFALLNQSVCTKCGKTWYYSLRAELLKAKKAYLRDKLKRLQGK